MAIEVIAEEVAENLEEIAEATRKLNTIGLGYLGVGIVVGAAAGFYFGYKMNRSKIRAEAFADADAEIETIRQVYQAKTLAAEPKPDLSETVERLGYVEVAGEPFVIPGSGNQRPLSPSVPITDMSSAPQKVDYAGLSRPETGNDSKVLEIRAEPEPDAVYPPWDYKRELAGRSAEQPYVIHMDEFVDSDFGFEQVEYSYYDVDDVISGEDNRPILVADAVVGLDNLKWGYGSGDPDVVYIRNHQLEREILLRRLRDRSYEQEVVGLDDTADTP